MKRVRAVIFDIIHGAMLLDAILTRGDASAHGSGMQCGDAARRERRRARASPLQELHGPDVASARSAMERRPAVLHHRITICVAVQERFYHVEAADETGD